eukprot:PhF_6_TR40199/c2_g1_i2/m.59654
MWKMRKKALDDRLKELKNSSKENTTFISNSVKTIQREIQVALSEVSNHRDKLQMAIVQTNPRQGLESQSVIERIVLRPSVTLPQFRVCKFYLPPATAVSGVLPSTARAKSEQEDQTPNAKRSGGGAGSITSPRKLSLVSNGSGTGGIHMPRNTSLQPSPSTTPGQPPLTPTPPAPSSVMSSKGNMNEPDASPSPIRGDVDTSVVSQSSATTNTTVKRIECRYNNQDLDDNGIIYFLGTNGRRQPFANPHTAGTIHVSTLAGMHNKSIGNEATLVSRNHEHFTITNDVPNGWICFD